MRVVAGIHGGRVLTAPKGDQTRPTSDRVKESLFAILRDDVLDAVVLDLFAGSGALGIEALSRGAAHATFVDRSARAIAAVRANLRALRVPAGDVAVVKSTVMAHLNGRSAGGQTYDLAFLDPPYDASDGDEMLHALGGDGAVHLSDGATVVLEHATAAPVADAYGLLTRISVRRYGDTSLSLFAHRQRNETDNPSHASHVLH
jgi:16S rRNA (guanine966-N2)-methyltransferase